MKKFPSHDLFKAQKELSNQNENSLSAQNLEEIIDVMRISENPNL